MLATFSSAIEVVLLHEGFSKYTDDPADPGGPTRWGISLKFLKKMGDEDGDGWLDGDLDHDGDVDVDDIRAMTRKYSEGFYRSQFWDRYDYARLASGYVATKIFDLSVNIGPGNAHRILQRACRACDVDVVVDGILGPKTVAAANAGIPVPSSLGCNVREVALLTACRSEAAGHYRGLAARRSEFDVYLKGWLNRAYS